MPLKPFWPPTTIHATVSPPTRTSVTVPAATVATAKGAPPESRRHEHHVPPPAGCAQTTRSPSIEPPLSPGPEATG